MEQYINHSIPNQLSSYINEQYPLFVEFLRAYYSWLESEGSPYYHLKNHLSYLDLSNSLDLYVSLLKNEYLHGIPEKVLADKKLLIKHSKEFLQSIGTEKAFKFIFKILYGEDVEITYPRDEILRASDGKWIENESVMYVSNSGNVQSFLYKRIKQTREPYPGIFEYGYATVNKIIQRYANKFNFCEVYLTDIQGSFDINHPIESDGLYEWPMPIASSATITSAGMGYISDNVLSYSGSPTFDITSTATVNGIVDGRYTTILTPQELTVLRNGNPLSGFQYDGKYITHSSIVAGDTITITYPVYEGLVIVESVGLTGNITSVEFIDTPFGITSNQSLTGSEGGSGASLQLIPSVVRAIPGYFLNTDGFLSADKVLQDGEYYQEFSYVIKASIDIEKYKDIVLKVLHPAGLLMIGNISILELINLMIKEVNLEISDISDLEYIEMSSVDLNSRYGFIEDFRYKFSDTLYKVHHFLDVRIEDIIYNYDRFYNVQDMEVIVTTSGSGGYYFEDGYIEDGYIV